MCLTAMSGPADRAALAVSVRRVVLAVLAVALAAAALAAQVASVELVVPAARAVLQAQQVRAGQPVQRPSCSDFRAALFSVG